MFCSGGDVVEVAGRMMMVVMMMVMMLMMVMMIMVMMMMFHLKNIFKNIIRVSEVLIVYLN